MKKRTAFIGAILSLIPIGQPLIIKIGVVLSTAGLILVVPESSYAKSSAYYYNLGLEKVEKGDHSGAIADYTKAIEIDPKHTNSYLNRGYAKDSLKDYYGAISDYTKAIEIKPESDAYMNRSISKENIGDIKGACFDAKKAVSLGDEDLQNASWIKENC